MAGEKYKINEYTKELHILFNSLKIYKTKELNSKILDELPKNGIYIIFEEGEFFYDLNKIVRIGTHTGNNQLPSRIKQHFIDQNKDRSIFRKHIGKALILKNNDKDNFLWQWEKDFTSKTTRENLKNKYGKAYLKKKIDVENAVTEYMKKNISFVVFPVLTKEERIYLERKLISTISWCKEFSPSENWLGNFTSNEKIKKSGLWNISGTFKSIETLLNENDMQKINFYCNEN